MTATASPTTDAHAMTPAQRQRAYRLRRKRAITDAIGEEAQASRVTLLSRPCKIQLRLAGVRLAFVTIGAASMPPLKQRPAYGREPPALIAMGPSLLTAPFEEATKKPARCSGEQRRAAATVGCSQLHN